MWDQTHEPYRKFKTSCQSYAKIENDWSTNSFSVINTSVGVAAVTFASTRGMTTDINTLVVSDRISYAPISSSCHLDEGRVGQIESVKCFQ